MSDAVTAAAPALRVEALAVRHRRRRVVADLTWEHRAGRVAWIVGENGAGKTSLLRVLAGRARPATGTVVLLDGVGGPGRRLYYRPAMRLPPRATVGEWLRFVAASGGEPPGVRLGPGVPPDRLLGRLSTGEARRLLLEALLDRPAAFVFLDEPYEHLSQRAREALTGVLVARARVSVVVVSTNQPVPPGAGGPILRLDDGRGMLERGEVAR